MVSIIILMMVGSASSVAIIWLYAITMGLGVGSWLPTASYITSTRFGLANYGTIFGVVTLFIYIGTATGPLVAGYMYDSMNTYHWAFIIFTALFVIAIPTILVSRWLKPL